MDTTRSLTLAGACTTFVAVPNLGALFGKGEQTDRYGTAITPPDYAFAVWAPIFAACAVSTVGQCLPGGRRDPTSRRTGWPLAGAYAVNTVWSLAAQTGRFPLTPYLLPLATALTATAHVQLQRTPPASGLVAATPASTGLLLGWTTLASAVNIVAARPDRASPGVVTAATAGLLATSAAVAVAAALSRRGGRALALSSGWALGTLACTPARPRRVRLAAALGTTMIGFARRLATR
ncbi:hypothetical protein FHR83_008768 [Actinoplanes campanulatus]|uniref:TspO and MBR related proteins n=1 Tax=Actinoplanes campanulatus TaxID=113559 RepID=A0A7W5ARN7_9ACTN|nr:hypothetical protein [Actinoplanes campanulatus]MBB3101040.1 hypothetical protein [Actinoplanes campanulatus]GGN49353.1 hypothetical protein GCM10010109_87330 [Actinoplanes campanulatus]GID41868.1 hypothetical protein Aca09nite_83740 [Actinoplanes campanulatus]